MQIIFIFLILLPFWKLECVENNKTILVVGGAGFIGSKVNQLLHQYGFQTVIYDNLSTGIYTPQLEGTFIQGDLGDVETLNRTFEQYSIDAVIHLAASIDVNESVQNPSLYYRNNVVNTLNLLNTMLAHGVKNLIFSSTAAVYGTPLEIPITEAHPCNPVNPYGQTKLMVEKILRDYDLAYGLKSICLRYFNAAGGDPSGKMKNYKMKESNLIPIALRAVKKNEPITIFGTDYSTHDGTCIRDYIHVYDLATAHIQAMEKLFQGGNSNCYNLGTGKGYSVEEVITTIQQITGIKLTVHHGPRRAGDVPIVIADSNKAFQDLGWKPQYPSLELIIRHAWQATE